MADANTSTNSNCASYSASIGNSGSPSTNANALVDDTINSSKSTGPVANPISIPDPSVNPSPPPPPNLTSTSPLSPSALSRIKLRAQESAQGLSSTHPSAADTTSTATTTTHIRHTLIDFRIQFIGATGLPKMDVMGTADPYFVASVDGRVKFISTVQPNTLNPVWNELWNVKNVPSDGKLTIKVYDKDDGTPLDDYIGTCELTLEEGTKEAKIEGLFGRNRGMFWAKVSTTPASSPHLLPYTFDGPVSYSRHFSPTVGLLTNLDDNGKRLYSTWKLRIRGVPSFLTGPPQHWNTAYTAAQRIFGPGPGSLAVRSSIQAGHRMLYARSTRNGFGTIDGQEDVFSLLTGGRAAPHRIKPAVYTYIISAEDDTLRFSETGAAFFVDFASKHALHANCAEAVRYSGEFHPRPKGGWAAFDENKTGDRDTEWELVVDNNSGTYAPDKTLLPKVRELIEYNFPGVGVVALDRGDKALEESREACREYAMRCRAEGRTELQPHVKEEGEETLSHQASLGRVKTKERVTEEREIPEDGEMMVL